MQEEIENVLFVIKYDILRGIACNQSSVLDFSLKLHTTHAFISVKMTIMNPFSHLKMSPQKRLYFPLIFMKNIVMIITKFSLDTPYSCP